MCVCVCVYVCVRVYIPIHVNMYTKRQFSFIYVYRDYSLVKLESCRQCLREEHKIRPRFRSLLLSRGIVVVARRRGTFASDRAGADLAKMHMPCA